MKSKKHPHGSENFLTSNADIVLCLVLTASLLLAPVAGRASGTVTNSSEADLRAALAGGGAVTFAGDGTITLTNTIAITTDTVIDGSGHSIKISGGNMVRLFTVPTNVTLVLRNLTLADGLAIGGRNGLEACGGGICSTGMLQVLQCVLTNNSALGGITGGIRSPGFGGAIFNAGTLLASNTTFILNQAVGGDGEPAFMTTPPAMAVGGAGSGGAIYGLGTTRLANCILSNNLATGGRGANGVGVGPVWLPGAAGGTGNGGAIFNQGTLSMVGSTLAWNSVTGGTGGQGQPGGPHTYDSTGRTGYAGGNGNGGSLCNAGGSATVLNSTIVGDIVVGGVGGTGGTAGPGGLAGGVGGTGGIAGNGYGGGICNLDGAGLVNLTNTTLSLNRADGGAAGPGGAGSAGGPNGSAGVAGTGSGGNLALLSGTMGVVNSIVADSPAGGNGFGSLTDYGHNLSSDGTCNFTGLGSLNTTTANLAPLADNGGQTPTMALLASSLAIDAGDSTACVATDQRGVARPFGGACDIGAFEYTEPLVPLTISASLSTNRIAVGDFAILQLLVSNPNSTPLTGISFVADLPGAVHVANPPNIANGCGAGSITAVVGTPQCSGIGFTLAGHSSCVVAVNVTSDTPGLWTNGGLSISSTSVGTNSSALAAALRVVAAPSAVTALAPVSGRTNLVLSGTVNPNGLATQSSFEWGFTTNLGNVTPAQSVGENFNSATVEATIPDLPPGTTCFFRVVAGNALGTSRGSLQTGFIWSGVVTSCQESDLRYNLSAGGPITFDCDGTIQLTSPISITRDAVLDASGHAITLSGSNAVRLFNVNTGVNFTLIHLTMADGRSTNGGAIYNEGGSLMIQNCILTNNAAVGLAGIAGTNGVGSGNGSSGTEGTDAKGGAIWSTGNLSVIASTFAGNSAVGGVGGAGGAGGGIGYGGTAVAGSGGNGGAGSNALGGAIWNAGKLAITNSTFVTNRASAGAGGVGGIGGASYYGAAGSGAAGGSGGSAYGGAIYSMGELVFVGTTFTTSRTLGGAGGGGGKSGYPVASSVTGVGGDGSFGGSAEGAAIWSAGFVLGLSSTFDQSEALGGNGGAGGGAQTSTATGYRPGAGGFAGPAFGGALRNAGTATLINVTIVSNLIAGGTGGDRGAGPFDLGKTPGRGGDTRGGALQNTGDAQLLHCTIAGNLARVGVGGRGFYWSQVIFGADGNASGSSLSTVPFGLTLANTIVSGIASNAACEVWMNDGGHNLCSDNSAALSAPGSRNNTDPMLGPLTNNGGPTLTMALRPGSPAINAGDNASCPPTDQRGVPRPFAGACDIGAFEYTYWMLTAAVSPGNVMAVHAWGTPGEICRLLASTTLTNWVPIATNTIGADGKTVFQGNLDAGVPQRFYKTITP